MFTGIVEEVGRVTDVAPIANGRLLRIAAERVLAQIRNGDSIAVDGVCLTVTRHDPDGFAVWGFEQLVHHRIPLYESIARKHGYAVGMEEIPDVSDEEGFLELVSRAIDRAG